MEEVVDTAPFGLSNARDQGRSQRVAEQLPSHILAESDSLRPRYSTRRGDQSGRNGLQTRHQLEGAGWRSGDRAPGESASSPSDSDGELSGACKRSIPIDSAVSRPKTKVKIQTSENVINLMPRYRNVGGRLPQRADTARGSAEF